MFKRKSYKFLLIHFIVVTLLFMCCYFILSRPSDSFNVEGVSEVLYDQKSDINSVVDQFALKENIDVVDLWEYNKQYNDVDVYVFDDDSLVFWTDRTNVIHLDQLSASSGLVTFDNGVFQYELFKKHNGLTFLILGVIQRNYLIRNTHLEGSLSPRFNQVLKGKYISLSQRENAASFQYEENNIWVYSDLNYYPMINEIIAFVFVYWVLAFIWLLLAIIRLRGEEYMFLSSFIVGLTVYIASIYGLPKVIFETSLFHPALYAASKWLPSLGHVYLIIIVFYSVVYAYIRFGERYLIIASTLVCLFPVLINFLTISIINNSFSELLDLNFYNLSGYEISGIIGVLSLYFSYIVFLNRYIFLTKNFSHKWLIYVVLFVIYCVASIQVTNEVLVVLWLPLIIGVIVFFENKKNVVKALFITLITCFMVSYIQFSLLKEKEVVYRNKLIRNIAKQKDPVANFLFDDIHKSIKNDTSILNNLADRPDETILSIEKKYFNGYWKKYAVSFVQCREMDSLLINPDNINVPCVPFFDERIMGSSEKNILNKKLFYTEDEAGNSSYIAKLLLKDKYSKSLGPLCLFVELVPKVFAKTEGYPELLLNKSEILDMVNIEPYSYAKYHDNNLVYSSGDVDYPLYFDMEFSPEMYQKQEKYTHVIYTTLSRTTYVLSNIRPSIWVFLAYFSFLFFGGFFFVLFFGLVYRAEPYILYLGRKDFTTKILMFLVSIQLLAFFAFSFGTSYFILEQYKETNDRNVHEKVNSLLTELEHKLGDAEELTTDQFDYVSYYLIKFSNVFFTDINLYKKSGELFASSRPEMFEKALMSKRMAPEAFHNLVRAKKKRLIVDAQIGSLSYSSAYVPFRNHNNKVLAYLNLPYFAKSEVVNKEMNMLYTTLINAYILILLITITITISFANYISRPFRMIKNKLVTLGLQSKNEPIQWDSNDEIGELIKAYNMKVLEIEKSAISMAKSEREGAWREMAKQVAHEIKNPLTPMKLSIQHLQLAAQREDDITKRIDRTAATLIEQIDTLAKIANEFSNFAQMPRTQKESIDIVPIVQNCIHLFEQDKVQIELERGVNEAVISGDKEQMTRVFNNLIKNAIQAIEFPEKGSIKLTIEIQSENYIVSVEDNGRGIPEELEQKIFVPNFTTKSTGMGLGLAMVSAIVKNHEGAIWFDTSNEGTVFYVSLPII